MVSAANSGTFDTEKKTRFATSGRLGSRYLCPSTPLSEWDPSLVIFP